VLKLTGAHIKLTETPPSIRTPSPELGQHNGEVFGSLLGMVSSDIERLTQDGVFLAKILRTKHIIQRRK
jgi:crotonobetainyl-CoA:carnitine CoA-transferase CaiB-like acyl-CoA transferase